MQGSSSRRCLRSRDEGKALGKAGKRECKRHNRFLAFCNFSCVVYLLEHRWIYVIMCLREKGTIEREVVMVTRTSKILMVIATVFTFLGVVLEILLHSNQQKFFTLFTAGIQLDEPVVHTVNLGSTILIFLLYLVSCIVLMCASKRTGFIMSIVALVLNLVIDVGARVGAVVMNRYMGMKGVKYFTGITLLDSLHGYVVAPMMLLAIVFLGITIGTLSQNRKEEEAVRNSYDSVTGI